MMQCSECGAQLLHADDSCARRFDVLLALDHSRREPWGSRHGQAFAAFALQHPQAYARSLDAAWDLLYRIYCLGEPVSTAIAARRANPQAAPIAPRPAARLADFTVTIADLGEFDGARYPAALDEWCMSALKAWGAPMASR